MTDERYNVVVIGGGSAGLVSAYIAATIKAKVALIERGAMGGDCLNTGCVPSKALIKSARLAAMIKQRERYGLRGLEVSGGPPDLAAVMERVHRIVATIAPHDSIERYQALGVECITGEAELVDRHTVRVNGRTLRTRAVILATGAEPHVPTLPGLEHVPFLTSENLWRLRELPRRLVVLGGGPIGCEMAQAFQQLGTEVTLVERGQRLMPREDEPTAALLAQHLRADGVTILTDTKAVAVQSGNGPSCLVTEQHGRSVRLEFDQILIAVGRKARTAGLDLDKLGLTLNPNGTLKVDDYLRANGDNIYACGDLAGPFQLTHVAAHQAWYCAVNALCSPFKKFKADYRVIPWVTFTEPEIATVGLTEDSAKARGISYETSQYSTGELDRAIAESAAEGFVKVLTVPGKDTILGVTIVSQHAGEMIAEYVTAMKHRLGLNKVLGTIHAYPTYSEANKYAAGVWKKAHKPEALLRLAAAFHRWRR